MAQFRCSQPRRLLLGVLLSVLLACCTPAAETVAPAVENTPTPAATPTLTAEQLAKIDPELLAVIEAEETQPGKGKEVAPDYFIFGPDDHVELRVNFDPAIVTISQFELQSPSPEQQAVQLIIRHGGQAKSTLTPSNSVVALLPLSGIKGLAREDGVMTIIPSRVIGPSPGGRIIVVTSSP